MPELLDLGHEHGVHEHHRGGIRFAAEAGVYVSASAGNWVHSIDGRASEPVDHHHRRGDTQP